jgi:hypothetical protein
LAGAVQRHAVAGEDVIGPAGAEVRHVSAAPPVDDGLDRTAVGPATNLTARLFQPGARPAVRTVACPGNKDQAGHPRGISPAAGCR